MQYVETKKYYINMLTLSYLCNIIMSTTTKDVDTVQAPKRRQGADSRTASTLQGFGKGQPESEKKRRKKL